MFPTFSNFSWVRKLTIAAMTTGTLSGCFGGADVPFTIPDDPSNTPPVLAPGGSETPGGGVGGGEGCVVNFNGTMQLNISANPPTASQPLHQEGGATPIDPIPIHVSGNDLTIVGDEFPAIRLTTLSESADLRIRGTAGSSATGTYDPDTGSLNINSLSVTIDLLGKTPGEEVNAVPGEETLSLDLITDSVTVQGNHQELSATGSPVNASDLSMTWVTGLVLPDDFPVLTVLNPMIAGGALTGVFNGNLDQLPENCVDNGGDGDSPGGGGGVPPTGFSIFVGESTTNTGLVDFGAIRVKTSSQGESAILNCAQSGRSESKKITIKNTGDTTQTFHIFQPQNTDNDFPDPGCAPGREFSVNAYNAHGSAQCRSKETGFECTIPGGQTENSYATFALNYQPNNFQAVEDTGSLEIQHQLEGQETQSYTLNLAGGVQADTSNTLSISYFVESGTASRILDQSLVSIHFPEGSSDSSFTQRMRLLNDGSESYTGVSMTIESEGDTFRVTPSGNSLDPAGSEPGSLNFDIIFTPTNTTQSSLSNGTLNIELTGADGSTTNLIYKVQGLVAIPKLRGAVPFYVSDISGKVNHPVTPLPFLSLPFGFDEFAAIAQPDPINFTFTDIPDQPSLKSVHIGIDDTNVANTTLELRRGLMRIFNAQASQTCEGRYVAPGETPEVCQEADDVAFSQPYRPCYCSYLYFILFGENGFYDEQTGHMAFPDHTLRTQNPHHAALGTWGATNAGSPSFKLDTRTPLALSSFVLNEKTKNIGGQEVDLLPSDIPGEASRISEADVDLQNISMGPDCPSKFDFLDINIAGPEANRDNITDYWPYMDCYLTSDKQFLQGRPLEWRRDLNNPNIFRAYIVLVGVVRYNPFLENGVLDPNMPWFLYEGSQGNNDGSFLYISLRGYFEVEGTAQ